MRDDSIVCVRDFQGKVDVSVSGSTNHKLDYNYWKRMPEFCENGSTVSVDRPICLGFWIRVRCFDHKDSTIAFR